MLFEIDIDTNQIRLNKPWIFLTKEFAALLKRDKGSKGDSEGRAKLKATKEFTFIYFMEDFGSFCYDWDAEEKWKQALYESGLTDDDIDEEVLLAKAKYAKVMIESSRSLRTYKAMLKGQDEMDSYFENIDFTQKDKKGELVNDPNKFADTIVKADKVYEAISKFKRRVEEELSQGAKTIRGTAELGDNETNSNNSWSENEIAETSSHISSGTRASGDFSTVLNSITKNKTQ